MALVIPLKAESTIQGHFPTFAKKASHNNGTCFFLLLYVGSGMKIGRRFVDDVHSTCLYVSYLSCCVIAHCCCVCYFYGYFFVVWRRLVVIDLL